MKVSHITAIDWVKEVAEKLSDSPELETVRLGG